LIVTCRLQGLNWIEGCIFHPSPQQQSGQATSEGLRPVEDQREGTKRSIEFVLHSTFDNGF